MADNNNTKNSTLKKTKVLQIHTPIQTRKDDKKDVTSGDIPDIKKTINFNKKNEIARKKIEPKKVEEQKISSSNKKAVNVNPQTTNKSSTGTGDLVNKKNPINSVNKRNIVNIVNKKNNNSDAINKKTPITFSSPNKTKVPKQDINISTTYSTKDGVKELNKQNFTTKSLDKKLMDYPCNKLQTILEPRPLKNNSITSIASDFLDPWTIPINIIDIKEQIIETLNKLNKNSKNIHLMGNIKDNAHKAKMSEKDSKGKPKKVITTDGNKEFMKDVVEDKDTIVSKCLKYLNEINSHTSKSDSGGIEGNFLSQLVTNFLKESSNLQKIIEDNLASQETQRSNNQDDLVIGTDIDIRDQINLKAIKLALQSLPLHELNIESEKLFLPDESNKKCAKPNQNLRKKLIDAANRKYVISKSSRDDSPSSDSYFEDTENKMNQIIMKEDICSKQKRQQNYNDSDSCKNESSYGRKKMSSIGGQFVRSSISYNSIFLYNKKKKFKQTTKSWHNLLKNILSGESVNRETASQSSPHGYKIFSSGRAMSENKNQTIDKEDKEVKSLEKRRFEFSNEDKNVEVCKTRELDKNVCEKTSFKSNIETKKEVEQSNDKYCLPNGMVIQKGLQQKIFEELVSMMNNENNLFNINQSDGTFTLTEEVYESNQQKVQKKVFEVHNFYDVENNDNEQAIEESTESDKYERQDGGDLSQHSNLKRKEYVDVLNKLSFSFASAITSLSNEENQTQVIDSGKIQWYVKNFVDSVSKCENLEEFEAKEKFQKIFNEILVMFQNNSEQEELPMSDLEDRNHLFTSSKKDNGASTKEKSEHNKPLTTFNKAKIEDKALNKTFSNVSEVSSNDGSDNSNQEQDLVRQEPNPPKCSRKQIIDKNDLPQLLKIISKHKQSLHSLKKNLSHSERVLTTHKKVQFASSSNQSELDDTKDIPLGKNFDRNVIETNLDKLYETEMGTKNSESQITKSTKERRPSPKVRSQIKVKDIKNEKSLDINNKNITSIKSTNSSLESSNINSECDLKDNGEEITFLSTEQNKEMETQVCKSIESENSVSQAILRNSEIQGKNLKKQTDLNEKPNHGRKKHLIKNTEKESTHVANAELILQENAIGKYLDIPTYIKTDPEPPKKKKIEKNNYTDTKKKQIQGETELKVQESTKALHVAKTQESKGKNLKLNLYENQVMSEKTEEKPVQKKDAIAKPKKKTNTMQAKKKKKRDDIERTNKFEKTSYEMIRKGGKSLLKQDKKEYLKQVTISSRRGMTDHLQTVYNAMVCDNTNYSATITSAKQLSRYLRRASTSSKDMLLHHWKTICENGRSSSIRKPLNLQKPKVVTSKKSLWHSFRGRTSGFLTQRK